MSAPRVSKAAARQWLAEVSYGVRPPDSAPSDVLLGPPGPAPPPPAAPPPAAQRAWRPLGPFSVPHGQMKGGYSDPRHAVSGRVSAFVVDPAAPAHLLAGAAGGGIWESVDRGATWDPRTDQAPSLAIGALAVDPTAPATMYAGTGEGNALWFLGAGLLRSGNSGHDWAPVPGGPFRGDGFFDLKVDPENGAHLLAGTVFGLWESPNSGATWFQRRAVRTWSLSFHPATGVAGASQEVFAACADGLQRSGDGGTHWAAVPLAGTPAGGWARLAVAHAPSAPDVVWVAGAGRFTGPPPPAPAPTPACDTGHLLRRPAAGAPFGALAVAAPAYALDQAPYDWVLAVAPDNPDVVWLGARDLYTLTRNSVTNAVALATISPTVAGDSLHADQHAIAFDPGSPATVYIGNDGGVFRTPDRGTTFQPLNRGLATIEFEYLAQHPQVDAWLLGGTQDNGTQRYEGTGTWYHVSDGDGGDCAVDEDAPSTVFHERFSRGGNVIHNLRSRAAGGWETWRYAPVAPANHPTLFYAPMEARGRMLVQAGQDVFISDQEGDAGSFARVALPALVPAPANPELVSAIAIADDDRVLVGTTQGRVVTLTRTPGVGPGWSVAVMAGTPFAAQPVSDLLVAPDDPRRVWATFEGRPTSAVARSDDGGTVFASATGDLTAGLRIYAIAADPANPPTVWVAADRGVYRSTDRGAHWTVAGAGLPNCQVKDLLFHPRARVLRAATKSRGAWELEVDLPAAAAPDVFVRYHPVDTGRALPAGTPAPVETPDPFTPAPAARWWESPDIKVDAAPHLASALGALATDVFADDHGVLAAGLFDEPPAPGQAARVYVQVHNRSAADAADVDVRVFAAAPAIGAPPLDAGFWTGWPANAPGAASAWQPIAAAVRIARLEAGRSRLAAFDWAVPADLPDAATLMAVAVPAGTVFAPAPTTISELLAATDAIGIGGRIALRPLSGASGPRPGAVQAVVHAAAGAGTYALEVDAGCSGMVAGAVLSTALSNLAGGAGARPLVEADHPALGALLARRPALGGQLDRTRLYVPPARGA
ncbi:MAG TPA: hypothetical protein VLB47_13240, partial [Solirubrobacteraceae bacterium]|nr:hypothetical protein [Solirubrobacteraceae bacterium]